jgi:hypothetical protein
MSDRAEVAAGGAPRKYVLIDVVWHAAGSAGESVRAQDHRGKKRASAMGCQIAINLSPIVDISNAITLRITAEHECSAPIARGGSAQTPSLGNVSIRIGRNTDHTEVDVHAERG